MWYALTIDLKIILCIFLQRLYGLIANTTLFLFKTNHPFVVNKVKKIKIDELRKSVELLQKNNEMNERVLGITKQGLEKIQAWPEYQDAECRTSHINLIASIRRNIEEGIKRKVDTETLIVEAQGTIDRLQKAKK